MYSQAVHELAIDNQLGTQDHSAPTHLHTHTRPTMTTIVQTPSQLGLAWEVSMGLDNHRKISAAEHKLWAEVMREVIVQGSSPHLGVNCVILQLFLSSAAGISICSGLIWRLPARNSILSWLQDLGKVATIAANHRGGALFSIHLSNGGSLGAILVLLINGWPETEG